MPTSTERPLHAALIPWVIALVALIGLNSIAPDFSRTRKSDSLGDTGLSQLADNPPALGHVANPLVYLVPHSICHAAVLVSRALRIEIFREEPPSKSLQGAVRGRAPPARLMV